MIDKTRIVDTVWEGMKALPISHCLDLRTYKRNRSVVIAKLAEDDLLVIGTIFFKYQITMTAGPQKPVICLGCGH